MDAHTNKNMTDFHYCVHVVNQSCSRQQLKCYRKSTKDSTYARFYTTGFYPQSELHRAQTCTNNSMDLINE